MAQLLIKAAKQNIIADDKSEMNGAWLTEVSEEIKLKAQSARYKQSDHNTCVGVREESLQWAL